MFIHYYDLRDEKRLPPGAYFEDPVDGSQYYTKEQESLQDFTNRVIEKREEKHLPSLSEESLKTLIVVSLSETTKENQFSNFFVRKSLNPSVSQVFKLAKTLISQRIQGKQADYLTRQERAAACNGCSLHDSKSRFAWGVTKIINAAASLEAIHQSDAEKKLGNCRACGCTLQSKTRFNIDAVLASIGPQDIFNILNVYRSDSFSKCWMLKEANSSAGTKDILKRKIAHLPPPYNAMLQVYEADTIQKAKNGRK